MADTDAIVTIDYAIDNILLSLQLETGSEEWVGQQVINCIREISQLHNAISIGVKDIILDVDTTTNTVDMPSDYTDWVAVGQIMNGYIYLFGFNGKISTIRGMNCGLPDYEFKSTVTGYGNIEFNENKRDRYLQFTGTPYNNRVYLKYITSGVTYDKQTFIPAELVTTLASYIDWRLAVIETRKNQTGASIANEQRKAQVYGNYLKIIKQNNNPLKTQNFYKILYRHNGKF